MNKEFIENIIKVLREEHKLLSKEISINKTWLLEVKAKIEYYEKIKNA